MPESVSTTTTFTLPIDEIIEEAMDALKAEGEEISGFDTRSARRSLNLLMIDLQNREIPLAHLEERSFSLTVADGDYNLGADVLAILDVSLVDSNSKETQLTAISPFDYFNKHDKTIEGQPNEYAFEATGLGVPRLKLFPVPDSSSYTLKYWVMRRHKDITKSYQLLDITHRYLPAVTSGLTYFLALKKSGFPLDRLEKFKMEYEERLERAFSMDRDRVDLVIVPDVSGR